MKTLLFFFMIVISSFKCHAASFSEMRFAAKRTFTTRCVPLISRLPMSQSIGKTRAPIRFTSSIFTDEKTKSTFLSSISLILEDKFHTTGDFAKAIKDFEESHYPKLNEVDQINAKIALDLIKIIKDHIKNTSHETKIGIGDEGSDVLAEMQSFFRNRGCAEYLDQWYGSLHTLAYYRDQRLVSTVTPSIWAVNTIMYQWQHWGYLSDEDWRELRLK